MGSHPINALIDGRTPYVVTLRIGGPALSIISNDVQAGPPEKNLKQTRYSDETGDARLKRGTH